jgi:hypothetical protein
MSRWQQQQIVFHYFRNTRLSLSVAAYGSGEANITVLSAELILNESKLENNVIGNETYITGLNPKYY